MQRSDWQGAEIEGLDTTGTRWDDADVMDTVWKGTIHDKTNFKRLRLRPKANRFVKFLPSTQPPFRTSEAKKAENQLKLWQQKLAAIDKMTGKKRQQAKTVLYNNQPSQPEDYCQFNKANLSGKNMAGVEISGMRLKGAKASYLNLSQALVNGIPVQTIATQPQNYNEKTTLLVKVLQGIKYKQHQPPILDVAKTIKAKSVLDGEAQDFKTKHKLAIQKSTQAHKSLLKFIQGYKETPGGNL
jgi:hypothetical protein